MFTTPGLGIGCELFQYSADPVFRTQLFCQKCISRYEHICNPTQTLFDQVEDHVDESKNAAGGGKQRAALLVLQNFLRPVVLGNVQLSAVVVDRYLCLGRAISFSENIVTIHCGFPLFFPFAFMTHHWLTVSNESLRACFAARTLRVDADAPRCGCLAHPGSLWITRWQFVCHQAAL